MPGTDLRCCATTESQLLSAGIDFSPGYKRPHTYSDNYADSDGFITLPGQANASSTVMQCAVDSNQVRYCPTDRLLAYP